MAIPPFDPELHVLPPHLGDGRRIEVTELSPYQCSILEFCRRFADTSERRTILAGFLSFRAACDDLGIDGLQWIGGSFVEDIEMFERRPPHDVDVVTFIASPTEMVQIQKRFEKERRLLGQEYIRNTYRVHHFWLPLCSAPMELIEMTRYWYGLFSHRRDKIWKGMLAIPLSPAEDEVAAKYLGSRS